MPDLILHKNDDIFIKLLKNKIKEKKSWVINSSNSSKFSIINGTFHTWAQIINGLSVSFKKLYWWYILSSVKFFEGCYGPNTSYFFLYNSITLFFKFTILSKSQSSKNKIL